MKSTKLFTLVLTSSIPLPILYLIGLGYHEGQLVAYGVPVGLYPITIEKTFSTAFIYIYANWALWLFVLPALFLLYAISLLTINYLRPKYHSDPSRFLLRVWAIEEWLRKYLDEEISKVILVAKVMFGIVYLGLIVFVTTGIAYNGGVAKGQKTLAVAKCSLTDNKSSFTFKGETKVTIKSTPDPIYAYILSRSDRFISYYSIKTNNKKVIVTKPMGEIIEMSRTGDIFAKSWGKETEIETHCKKVNIN
jgi:hypothetical protein